MFKRVLCLRTPTMFNDLLCLRRKCTTYDRGVSGGGEINKKNYLTTYFPELTPCTKYCNPYLQASKK